MDVENSQLLDPIVSINDELSEEEVSLFQPGRKHLMRNATLFILFVIFIIGVAVGVYLIFTEEVFSWLGIGIGVVRFENSVCPAANGLSGTCYTRRQCSVIGGYASGKCAKNIGACCVVQVGCGATSGNNNTYFTNTGFPNTFAGGSPCSLSIERCNSDVCQIRIDFLSFSLAQPIGDGVCISDALVISGSGTSIGRICGENTGQHIYLDFNDNNPIELTIFTGATSFARQWNIKIAQIGCDSPSKAPTGCLKYFGDLSGTIRSFNYGQTANTNPTSTVPSQIGTRQLARMNYGICIRMQAGFCSIQWSSGSDPYAFSVSGNTVTDIATPPTIPSVGSDCTTDFVVIPNGAFTLSGVARSEDRYCGNLFPTVTSFAKPFVLTAVTNGDEVGDVANRGFSLSYTQQRCGSGLL